MKSCQWPPLESDPEIFNKYFHSIGVPDNVYFKELLGLEYKEFMSIGGPVLGLILNFTRTDKKVTIPENSIMDPSFVPYFMKQTSDLDNACGLIAGLHLFGNNTQVLKFNKDSIIQKFFDKAMSADSLQRAKDLEDFAQFKEVHNDFANQGQTELTNEEVNGHYICFINYQDCLYELDGLKKGPYCVKENVKSDEFMDAATKEIMRRVQEKEINEQISVMICCDENSKVVDFFAE